MGYNITDKEAKGIKVDMIFKLDTLDNHLEDCISTITPIIDVLSEYKHLYEPKAITDYYGRLKRKYEARKCEWLNMGKLWQTN